MDIVFGCSKNDKEFKDLIESTFPEAEECENFSVSGMEEIVCYIVPVAALVVQLADFILAHFGKNDDNERYVMINGKKKVFKGYTKDEVIEILGKIK